MKECFGSAESENGYEMGTAGSSIFADLPKRVPTKPSKLGFDGFVGGP